MKRMILLSSICLFSSLALAGVKENKAIKEGDEAIAEQLTKFKADCGGNLKVTSTHKDATLPAGAQSDQAGSIAAAGKRCGDVLYAMAEVCKNDADYKAEFGKLTELKCNPKNMDKKPYWVPAKAGTVLTVTLHPFSSGSDEIEKIKGLF